jgi:hypothetical protein
MIVSEGEVYNAFRAIINSSYEKSLNWAVDYARAGLNMKDEELKVQCLYVLNNITHWRGTVAKESRDLLKKFAKRVK